MKDFWQAFLPMFVSMDPVGLIPFFVAFTSGTAASKRQRVIIHSVATALIVALAFLFAGRAVLKWLGVGIPDFLVAGGALLFVLALADLLAADKPSQTLSSTDETLGVVPLAVPMIVGPAVLATSQVLLNRYGYPVTIAAIATNILLTGIILQCSGIVVRLIGGTGARVISKLAMLILAALAVMFIRSGLALMSAAWGKT
ncbi:MAG: MarC family protein [Candidatus Brocadiia bacterium]